jgi:ATP-binding cassette subfamily F protein 3
MSSPLLTLSDAECGYEGKTVLNKSSLSLTPGTRIGLLGPNGAGKSTLVKTLVGDLTLCNGERHESDNLKIGYFAQHQLEALDMAASPLLHIKRITPSASEQEIRNFLGSFGFIGDRALEPVQNFSGGEKARLALALVVWQNPNLLILDEPTNHLDLEMRHALEVAINGFEGALVLVSHDRHLLRNAVEDLILVEGGKTLSYEEDLANYEQWVLSSNSSKPEASASEKVGSRKEQRQDAAERRAKLKPLKKIIEKAEQAIQKKEQQLGALKADLGDPSLYEEEQKDALKALLKHEGELRAQLDQLEAEWLEHQSALEALESETDI